MPRTPPFLLIPFHFLLLLSAVFTAAVADSLDTYNTTYTDCPIVECGAVNISYPFWYKPGSDPGTNPSKYCGYRDFGITCSDNKTAHFTTLSDNYTVESINQEKKTISLVDSDVVGKSCPRARHNVNISNIPALNFTPDVVGVLFFFNCSAYLANDPSIKQNVAGCLQNQSNLSFVFRSDSLPNPTLYTRLTQECSGGAIESRVRSSDLGKSILPDVFGKAMNKGFDLNWDLNSVANDNDMTGIEDCRICEANGGRCGYKNGNGGLGFNCFCTDGCFYKAKGLMHRQRIKAN